MLSKKICFLGVILILPSIILSAHAENSWTVSLSPYDGLKGVELFKPLELPISSGDAITWINNDQITHKIVSGVPQHGDYSGEFFSTDILSPGDNYSISLDFEGYAGYYYFCEIHPWFTGKIFFEDREGIFESTLDISYDIVDSKTVVVQGTVEPDLGTTTYEALIFDSENNLVFQKINSFEQNGSFKIFVDISDYTWKHDKEYVFKLAYGVPSESTKITLKIPTNQIDSKIKFKKLESYQNSRLDSNLVFENTSIVNLYEQSLSWFGEISIIQKGILGSIDFIKNQITINIL